MIDKSSVGYPPTKEIYTKAENLFSLFFTKIHRNPSGVLNSYVGRKKRFLKIYGNRVNLDEVDRLIKGMKPMRPAQGWTTICVSSSLIRRLLMKSGILLLKKLV